MYGFASVDHDTNCQDLIRTSTVHHHTILLNQLLFSIVRDHRCITFLRNECASKRAELTRQAWFDLATMPLDTFSDSGLGNVNMFSMCFISRSTAVQFDVFICRNETDALHWNTVAQKNRVESSSRMHPLHSSVVTSEKFVVIFRLQTAKSLSRDHEQQWAFEHARRTQISLPS